MNRPGITRAVVIAVVAMAVSCSSSARYEPMPEVPGAVTLAQLSGPLCTRENSCLCKETDDAAGTPESEGVKRFEVRLGPSQNEQWAKVGEHTLYKSLERATECFYVDLRPGSYPISVRARGDGGFGAKLTISEQGKAGPWWYDTFEFSCGAPGLCDKSTLRDWKRRVAARGKKQDPCGSTKIAGITWQTGRMPDNLHPSDILVSATMQVYQFAPVYPPGDENCAAK